MEGIPSPLPVVDGRPLVDASTCRDRKTNCRRVRCPAAVRRFGSLALRAERRLDQDHEVIEVRLALADKPALNSSVQPLAKSPVTRSWVSAPAIPVRTSAARSVSSVYACPLLSGNVLPAFWPCRVEAAVLEERVDRRWGDHERIAVGLAVVTHQRHLDFRAPGTGSVQATPSQVSLAAAATPRDSRLVVSPSLVTTSVIVKMLTEEAV